MYIHMLRFVSPPLGNRDPPTVCQMIAPPQRPRACVLAKMVAKRCACKNGCQKVCLQKWLPKGVLAKIVAKMVAKMVYTADIYDIMV